MTSHVSRVAPLLAIVTILCIAFGWASPSEKPRLLLVITVDQMRGDYLERYGDQFSGGLAHLLSRGAVYTDAHQDHACTVTGVGHATIAAGMHPSSTGIVGNTWYDRAKGRIVECTEDPLSAGGAPGPGALRTTTFADWLLKEQPARKVVSISRKDRSAILMAGKNPTGVFWYDAATGGFTSSSHYGDRLPEWVLAFNAGKPADRYYGKVWERLLPPESYSRSTPDDQEGEGDPGRRTFPYQVGSGSGPDSSFYSQLAGTPFLDELTLELASRALRAEKLGRRGTLDILAVSLSAIDTIGHRFGPDSHEVHDSVLRLDRQLGRFFEIVDGEVGLDRTVIVFSADHGVQTLPEVQEQRGTRARRVTREFIDLLQTVEASLTEKFGPGPWIEKHVSFNLYLDRSTMEKAGVRSEDVETCVAELVRTSPIIEDAFTRTELLSGRPHQTPYTYLFVNAFHPANSGDVLLQIKPDHLVQPSGTNHGTPYRYDTHVALVFAGPGIPAGRHAARVRTVDIAPTLAALLGFAAPPGLDGHALFSPSDAVKSGVDKK